LSDSLTIGRSAGGTAGRPAVRAASAGRGFHIASLDGIRAVAALIVFVAHTGLQELVPGGFGVTVFFFLSGYLITTLLRREYAESGRINLRNFYLRRVCRIFPPLYLVLLVLIALSLSGAIRGGMQPGAVVSQLAHLTNYYVIFHGDIHAPLVPYTLPMWSLAVEEHFYLLFPLALLLMLRRATPPRAAAALALGCALVLAWRCVLMLVLENGAHYNYHATDTRLDSLLYGCILALWMNPALDPAPARISPRAWGAICALALGVLVFTFLYRSPFFRETFRYSLQGIALFPLFYCAVRFHRSPLFSWLGSAPMRGLGIISYTFYLCHEACFFIAGDYLDDKGWLRTVAGFALAVTFSCACYLLIERRFADLRRRLHA
jgi:peptidoglycan/LPS O-acetylase OafA/YrhL